MSSLLWDAALLRLMVVYRRFDTTYRSHLQGLSSLRRLHYQYTPHNIRQELRPQLHRGVSLKSRTGQ